MVALTRERLGDSDTRLVVGAVTVVDEDDAAARAHARQQVALYLPVVAGRDPTVDIDPHVPADEIPDDVLDLFAFAGEPARIVEHARRLFEAGGVRFGVAICHEGWRYPETVRWAVRNGAQVVFHPHFHIAQPGSYQPSSFADPENTFHEKAALCRAAENTCYFATVNFASAGSPSTSAVVRPDGTLLCYQPYGKEGLLIADIDLNAATGLLAARWNPIH